MFTAMASIVHFVWIKDMNLKSIHDGETQFVAQNEYSTNEKEEKKSCHRLWYRAWHADNPKPDYRRWSTYALIYDEHDLAKPKKSDTD